MTQNSFNPADHLIQIRGKDGTMKDYLPAAWRLYQARHEIPDLVLESEIIHMDVEHNFVIVKASAFVGTDYASATFKCSAMKQGLLSQLDRVETGAKARCLRDLGISTELALDITELEESNGDQDLVVDDELQAQVDALKIDFELLYNEKPGVWQAVVTKQLGKLPQRWTPEMLVRMKGYYLQCQQRLTQLRQAAAAEIVLE